MINDCYLSKEQNALIQVVNVFEEKHGNLLGS